MTEDSNDNTPRAEVAFGSALAALLALVAADIFLDLPWGGYYLGAGYLATIIALSLFRHGLIEDASLARKYVVRRHYLDAQVEYVTRSRNSALAYAKDLLDGMVDFIADNPQSEADIVKEYTVSITLPLRKAKHIPKMVTELRDVLTDKFVGFMLDHVDVYSLIVTTAVSSTAAEIKMNISLKEDAVDA